MIRPSPRSGCATAVVLGLALLGTLLDGVTGPQDPASYPDRATSPYLLPWAGGERHLCAQGNRGLVSHRESDGEHAWDFAMPVGTPVHAARAGTVRRVVDTNEGNGPDRPNNLVAIDHGDGTVGWYLHLMKGGARVTVGERVEQGQLVALSGHVGRSMFPHLHVHVTRDGRTIPISFRDVEGDGIPRMLRGYASGNTR
jgi:murein DD-endopeptidase MepM/ murein hydrolase activator NlpD